MSRPEIYTGPVIKLREARARITQLEAQLGMRLGLPSKADEILQDICEMDKANPDDRRSICVDYYQLCTLIRRHLEPKENSDE